jgi:4-hydroxybenzoate polyprenyltransferase/phosphoserine phosphatase
LSDRPLVVDLDGTLILTDMLHESALKLLRERPLAVLQMPFQLAAGKAQLKQYIARHTELSAETLPYNTNFLQWLREERGRGRQLILCTASDHKFAQQVADYLDLFDDVMASDGSTNLKGEQKARDLVQRFGRGNFDYAGNSRADLPIWECAAQAIVVNAGDGLAAEAALCCPVVRTFAPQQVKRLDWLRALRIQQWLKNLLLFAPMLAAHRLTDPGALLLLVLAFFSFGMVASATYLMNDLLDLESDRLHPRKRKRPLAAGLIPAPAAIAVGGGLLLAGLLLASAINLKFLACLLCYLFVTCCYTWFLKRQILLDCITLAMLYTLRIIAGAAAMNMGLSFWLLSFSAFLFLSLAFVKRYAEIEVQLLEGRDKVHGRGYYTPDAPLLQTLGVSAGYAAALVLSLYLNSEEILLLYQTPEIVWGAVFVLLYWISWMWIQAHRGHMHDDPLVFAIKDKTSLLAGVVFLLVLSLGTVELPW